MLKQNCHSYYRRNLEDFGIKQSLLEAWKSTVGVVREPKDLVVQVYSKAKPSLDSGKSFNRLRCSWIFLSLEMA